jgi:TolB-like protein/DNA-binding winged helix-turn-helix (wHTH) protein/Tfp pilus assembly protein PilF
MQPQQAPQIYEFGDFELDALRRVLVSRADRKPVDITGRVLDALIFLVERPGQLVEKKALIDALWPNVIVEEGNLTQTIHTLRRVLGEKAGEHRYVVTIQGRGYKFVAEVRTRAVSSEAVAPPAVPSRRPKWVLAGSVLALLLLGVGVFAWRSREPPVHPVAVTAHPSIAVLPFVDMSTEQDQAHFADGLSEEILNILAHADNLRVIARTSSFSFKGENVDIKTIATRLGVSYVLEGSVRKSGGRLRITAQLIDGATSAHVWSDTYDRDVNDIFGVQREIAASVADAMRVTLARAAPRRAETTSADAYDHYLQGRHLFDRRSKGDLQQAKRHFEEAVRIDPNYARAWTGIAGVYYVSLFSDTVWPDMVKNWGDAAMRGVTLDPELPEANVRAGQYELMNGKRAEGNAHLARAMALDPNDPLVLSITLSDALVEGRIEDAVAIQQRVVAVDPLSGTQREALGIFLLPLGRLTEAQAELERALELSPTAQDTAFAIADLMLLQGRPDEALGAISHLHDGYRRDARLALIAYARGAADEGDAILKRLTAMTQDPDFDPGVAVAIAQVYAANKEPDRAFEWLYRALPRTKRQLELRNYWAVLEDLNLSPHLGPLRSDPRWAALLAKARAELK